MTGAASKNEGRSAAKRRFVAGTRSSRLASWQTDHILSLLRNAWPDREWLSRDISTHGDERRDRPLAEIGGRGAFTEALERLLVGGEIDFAVHSLKDLPVRPAPGLVVAAVVGPRNAGEVLVSHGNRTLEELPSGAVVGTSSLRRQAQLLHIRPDLTVRPIRGNVETRIAKVERGEYDATLLAGAGVDRLDLHQRISGVIDPELMLPAPGQGAIAVQCRKDDELMVELLSAIGDPTIAACVRAERTFLGALGGGCSAPVAAFCVAASQEHGSNDGRRGLRLRGRVVEPDGGRAIDVEANGESPTELGVRLAGEALVRGAGEILRACSASGGSGLLDGKRIVVTRAREQAGELTKALEAHGARVLLLPVVRTTPLSDAPGVRRALAEIADYRWVVFASANAVRVFFEAARRGQAGKWSPRGRFAAVGPATSSAIEEAGCSTAFVSRGKSGAELGRELPEVEGARVLIPCAEEHGTELEEELERRGARVTTLAIYRTEQVPIAPDGIEELKRGVDAVLFTSGSTVTSFLRVVRDQAGSMNEALDRATIACIGPSTAQVARRSGLSPQVVAEEHTVGGLVAALVQNELEKRE